MKKFVTTGISALAAVLALSLTAVSLPVSAMTAFEKHSIETSQNWTVPEGYNEHDYNKCASFFEIMDENGVKNGEKLDAGYNELAYDPSDPTTWVTVDVLHDTFEHVHWTEVDGELRLSFFDVGWIKAVGTVDLSNCTELDEIEVSGNGLTEIDVSGCSKLTNLLCDKNAFETIDISDNAKLQRIWCDKNNLTELDVSNNPELVDISCKENKLTELDTSNNPELVDLWCGSNSLTSLDLSNNTKLGWLWFAYNQIESIDLSACPKLIQVFGMGNKLHELDLSKNTLLRDINLEDNLITRIDISANPDVRELTLLGNPLTELVTNEQLWPDTIGVKGNGSFEYHYSVPYEEGLAIAHANDNAEFEGWFNAQGELVGTDPTIITNNVQYGALTARFTSDLEAVLGDVDGNGSVSVADAVLAMRISMGILDGAGYNVEAGDTNGDGKLSVADSILILRIAMGMA